MPTVTKAQPPALLEPIDFHTLRGLLEHPNVSPVYERYRACKDDLAQCEAALTAVRAELRELGQENAGSAYPSAALLTAKKRLVAAEEAVAFAYEALRQPAADLEAAKEMARASLSPAVRHAAAAVLAEVISAMERLASAQDQARALLRHASRLGMHPPLMAVVDQTLPFRLKNLQRVLAKLRTDYA